MNTNKLKQQIKGVAMLFVACTTLAACGNNMNFPPDPGVINSNNIQTSVPTDNNTMFPGNAILLPEASSRLTVEPSQATLDLFASQLNAPQIEMAIAFH